MIPVAVCSYKRPKATFLKRSVKYQFPLYVFVRSEEYDDYKWLKKRPHTRIVKLLNVDNIGDTRRLVVEYAKAHNMKRIFMVDDDITRLDLTEWSEESQIAKASGTVKGTPEDWDVVLAEWERIWDDDIAMLGASYRPFCWSMKQEEIHGYKRGQIQACVGIDIAYLKNHNLNYRPIGQVGNEDLALQYEIIQNGGKTLIANRIQYDCPAMGEGKGGCCDDESVQDKQIRRVKAFSLFYGEDPRYRVGVTLKTKIPSIKFNWKSIEMEK